MPSRIDPEPYFFRWLSCVPFGSKDQPELVGKPCYRHKTCGRLVALPEDRIPPKVCPCCNADTVAEAKREEVYTRNGAVLLEAPSAPALLKPDTFK